MYDFVYRYIEHARLRRLESLLLRRRSLNDDSKSDSIGTSSRDEEEGDEYINGLLEGVAGDSRSSASRYCLHRGDGIEIFILETFFYNREC